MFQKKYKKFPLFGKDPERCKVEKYSASQDQIPDFKLRLQF